MFPEPTELLLIGCLMESIWTPRSKSNTLTPKTNSQTYWPREISHVLSGTIFLCLFNISHFRKPGENQIWKSNTSGSWNEQQPRTVRLMMGASSSDYSEWNIDEKWSSQEWKSGVMLGARTGRPVGGQQFTQEIDKFVIKDDDMDSDTATESNISLKSQSFLRRVNDRVRKILDHSSTDATQDIDKRSLIWWMFMTSTLEASVFMGKNYSEHIHSVKNKENDLTLKQMFDISEKVDSRTIRWDFWSVSNQLGRFSMETIFGQWWRSHQSLACKVLRILRFCVMSWKDESESEPSIKYCLRRTVELVQRFTTIQNFGQNWRRADGIRVEYFPRIHHIAGHQQSPRVHDQNGRPITIQRTTYLHVDVQWHHMEK